MIHVFWFRKNLRLKDNRTLLEFIKDVSDKNKFSFLYIKNSNTYRYFGEKRIIFLNECLTELKNELNSFSFNLQIVEGKSTEVFRSLTDNYGKLRVYADLQVEPYCIQRDEKINSLIKNNDGDFLKFGDSTIFDFNEVKNGEGSHYKVFTPFKNEALRILNAEHYKTPDSDLSVLEKKNETVLKDLKNYNPESSEQESFKTKIIKGGRTEGLNLLKNFYLNKINEYKTNRDFPDKDGTSLLSAHLHFGTVGIREALKTAINKLEKCKSEKDQGEIQTWINELLWREFYYHITFHNPKIMHESFKSIYDKVRWNYDEDNFKNWCDGMTGYPIVDAGMRQLKKEGWMHNRVRMITAMFLTKDLMTDWRMGEKYFAENLIDMDFSSNNGGWQWSASTGVDAQPYFRIFNPYLQSKKFDTNGNYIRKYVPELKNIPNEFIHEPDKMNIEKQRFYKVIIGKDYPSPIVDHYSAKEIVIKRFREATVNN